MTAPFAPPPPLSLYVVLALMFCFAVLTPFLRRDDWLGWLGFAVLIVLNVVLWGLLLRAWGLAILHWIRGQQVDSQ